VDTLKACAISLIVNILPTVITL